MQIFESFCYAIGVCASLHHAYFCTEEEFGEGHADEGQGFKTSMAKAFVACVAAGLFSKA